MFHGSLDVGSEDLVEGVEEFHLVAGQESAVDASRRQLRDDVHLVAGVQHRGVSTVAQGRAQGACDQAELGDSVVQLGLLVEVEVEPQGVIRSVRNARTVGVSRTGHSYRPAERWPPRA